MSSIEAIISINLIISLLIWRGRNPSPILVKFILCVKPLHNTGSVLHSGAHPDVTTNQLKIRAYQSVNAIMDSLSYFLDEWSFHTATYTKLKS